MDESLAGMFRNIAQGTGISVERCKVTSEYPLKMKFDGEDGAVLTKDALLFMEHVGQLHKDDKVFVVQAKEYYLILGKEVQDGS